MRFNYTTWLKIINTEKTKTNQLQELDCWDVIDSLDLEQEIEAEQQSFLFLATVALSFLESYYAQNSKPVQSAKWDHQRLDWNDHVTKLLHENMFHLEYRMSLQAFNHLMQDLLRPSITVNAVKSNASSGLYTRIHGFKNFNKTDSLFILFTITFLWQHTSLLATSAQASLAVHTSYNIH